MSDKKRILIVDDIPSNIKTLNSLLKLNYDINVATSGEEALSVVTSNPPDLILLDIVMPGMDGYELCRQLKDEKKTKKIPIIFVSAKGEVSDEQKGFELGAVDYITKPISPPIVLARVENHLQLKQARDSLTELVAERTLELEQAYDELKSSHDQILHQEKLATIGQLAAGVAHEINNPIGYILSNIGSLKKYLDKLVEFNQAELEVLGSLDDTRVDQLKELRKKLKIDFILEDISDITDECLEGSGRIIKIVMGLKNFSRKDQDDLSSANINDCIESTLDIAWNELKYKTTIQKEYGDLPFTKCYPQQLNQVFMNLLVNAAHSIDKQGRITIKTWADKDSILVSISDTGCGIAPENLEKVFEAFFTTKELGKGTGLGMSIVAEIIKKHKGDIKVESKVGEGTTFTIQIPLVI